MAVAIAAPAEAQISLAAPKRGIPYYPAPIFNRNFRDGLREVGFEMELHQARHVSAYFILSVDPNGWDDAAALLRVDVATARRHYGWMDTHRASAAGREKLREARKRANRHHKGTF